MFTVCSQPGCSYIPAATAASRHRPLRHHCQQRRPTCCCWKGAIRLLRCVAEGRDFGDMAGIDVAHASLHPLAWPPRQDMAGAGAAQRRPALA